MHKLTKEKYNVGMAIAEGSFATVKHCTAKQEHKEFLLRVIHKASVFGQDDKVLQEVEIMRMVRHENVHTVLDYWESSSEICLVMEPVEVYSGWVVGQVGGYWSVLGGNWSVVRWAGSYYKCGIVQ